MIELAPSLICTGCFACVNVCAHQAVAMVADEEGFLQPVINAERCVECGVCSKKCPALNPIRKELFKQEAYAVISHHDRTLSSSGGAFSVFARWILNEGGVVFGASIDANLQVKHIGVEHINDLYLLRGSKYVQSMIGDTYRKAKVELDRGRKVLFTGTGCQIAGLYKFLGRNYDEKLVTLDLVCHGVPSQVVFDAYIEKLEKAICLKGGNIKEFRFRKFDSWSIIPAIKFTESKWRILNLSENAYMNAFFKGLIFRESCFQCQYCNTQRIGTFSIADFWGIGCHGQPFKKNVACGVSLVIDNGGLMPQIQSILSREAYIEQRNMSEAIAEQMNLKAPMPRLENRDVAIRMLLDPNTSLKEFAKTCGLPWKMTPKYLMVKTVKDLIYLFGLYNAYKTLIYKLGKS